jgi:hypothetical protein
MKPFEIIKANRSSRSSGAVGGHPTRATQHFIQLIPSDPYYRVLDFGAGRKATQSAILRGAGYQDVTAYEFGDNVIEGIHDKHALRKQYDAILVSNVLNVQSSHSMLQETLCDIRMACAPECRVICNYPGSPRYIPIMAADDLEAILKSHFRILSRVGGMSYAPVWCCIDPRH